MGINAEDGVLVLQSGKDKNFWLFVLNSPITSQRCINSLKAAPVSNSPPVASIDPSTSTQTCLVPYNMVTKQASFQKPQPTGEFPESSSPLALNSWVVMEQLPAFSSAWVCASRNRDHFMEMYLLALHFRFSKLTSPLFCQRHLLPQGGLGCRIRNAKRVKDSIISLKTLVKQKS